MESISYNDSSLCCQICYEYFNLEDRVPRIIGNCGHYLCSNCIITVYTKNDRLICPECRTANDDFDGKINTLNKCYYLTNFLMANSKNIKYSSNNNTISTCKTHNKKNIYIDINNKLLCGSCNSNSYKYSIDYLNLLLENIYYKYNKVKNVINNNCLNDRNNTKFNKENADKIEYLIKNKINYINEIITKSQNNLIDYIKSKNYNTFENNINYNELMYTLNVIGTKINTTKYNLSNLDNIQDIHNSLIDEDNNLSKRIDDLKAIIEIDEDNNNHLIASRSINNMFTKLDKDIAKITNILSSNIFNNNYEYLKFDEEILKFKFLNNNIIALTNTSLIIYSIIEKEVKLLLKKSTNKIIKIYDNEKILLVELKHTLTTVSIIDLNKYRAVKKYSLEGQYIAIANNYVIMLKSYLYGTYTYVFYELNNKLDNTTDIKVKDINKITISTKLKLENIVSADNFILNYNINELQFIEIINGELKNRLTIKHTKNNIKKIKINEKYVYIIYDHKLEIYTFNNFTILLLSKTYFNDKVINNISIYNNGYYMVYNNNKIINQNLEKSEIIKKYINFEFEKIKIKNGLILFKHNANLSFLAI